MGGRGEKEGDLERGKVGEGGQEEGDREKK